MVVHAFADRRRSPPLEMPRTPAEREEMQRSIDKMGAQLAVLIDRDQRRDDDLATDRALMREINGRLKAVESTVGRAVWVWRIIVGAAASSIAAMLWLFGDALRSAALGLVRKVWG